MSHGTFMVPPPQNEPVLSYAPGSEERANLKTELEAQKSQTVDIPLIIGEDKIFDRETLDILSPHNRNLHLAKVAQANRDDISKAIDTALTARKEWAALPWEERAAVFLKAADLISGK